MAAVLERSWENDSWYVCVTIYQVNEVLPVSTKTDKEQSLCWKHGIFTKKTKFSKTKHKALFLCELDMGSVQVRNRVVYRFEIQKALGLQSFLMFSGVRMESVIFFKGPIAIEGF